MNVKLIKTLQERGSKISPQGPGNIQDLLTYGKRYYSDHLNTPCAFTLSFSVPIEVHSYFMVAPNDVYPIKWTLSVSTISLGSARRGRGASSRTPSGLRSQSKRCSIKFWSLAIRASTREYVCVLQQVVIAFTVHLMWKRKSHQIEIAFHK